MLTLCLLIVACHARVPDIPIRTESLEVPVGTRILLATVESGLLMTTVRPMNGEVRIPGIRFVSPPASDSSSISLTGLDPAWMKDSGAGMALLIREEITVLRLYNPYSVVDGFETQTRLLGTRDGIPVYDHRTVPVYRTEYRHRCTRTDYRIYQYGGDGSFMGQAFVGPGEKADCPERTDTDVTHDARTALDAWLMRHLRTSAATR